MKHIRIAVDAARRLKPVTGYVENIPDTSRVALATFGVYQPVYINNVTKRVLNPVWLATLLERNPAGIDCLLIEVPQPLEMCVSIALNGGVEGWSYNIPANMDEVIPHLRRMMKENRPALLALGGEPDYWDDFFHWIDHPRPQRLDPTGLIDPLQLIAGDLDMPRLKLELQATDIPTDITAWNSTRRRSGRKQYTSYHFYVEDFRFSALAKQPRTLIELGVQVAVEPNFSTNEDMPFPVALHDIWRKRQIAAEWQAAGIQIIVDLNVTRRYLKTALLGVPAGWQTYANRAYMKDLDHLHIAYEIARQHSGGKEIVYMVYGGPGCRALCQQNGWQWIDAGKTLDGVGYGERNQAD